LGRIGLVARELAVDDRVFVYGSFGFEPEVGGIRRTRWIRRSRHRVHPGRSDRPAALVELDDELVLTDGIYGTEGREGARRVSHARVWRG
jgi:hypothetical protein